MIPQTFIDELNARIDLVELIGRYVPLKPKGKDHWGCCPFHAENTPSFTVVPSKGFYHCFGCGEHGNALNFLMTQGGMGFIDAIKHMAEIAGLSLPEQENRTTDKDDKRRAGVLIALKDAADLYHHLLGKNVRALAYLCQRGVSDETIVKYRPGYAPDEWDTVTSSYRFKKQALEDAGLIIRKDNDKRYDRFRDRIMFPIFNRRGEVLAFGGRIIDKGDPKYLNSPETVVFHKGSELYGVSSRNGKNRTLRWRGLHK